MEINRDRTEIRTRLQIPETRPRAVAAIVAAIKRGETLEGGARLLGISLRTLHRILAQDRALAAALEK